MRFVGDFRPGDREFMESLGLADRVELIDYVPRRESLALQRNSDALLLLIPDAGGRGRGVLSGKVFEYLAAERPILAAVPPDGAAAQLIRDTGAGVVAAADDVAGLRAALVDLHAQWRDGKLDGTPLSPEWRDQLSRARRVEELADLLGSLAVTAAAVAVPRAVSRTRVADFFFLATFFCVTFEKVHWNLAGSVGIADVLTILFLVSFVLTSRGPTPRTTGIVLLFFAAFLLVYLLGFFNLETKQGLRPVHQGDGEVRAPLPVPRRGGRVSRAARRALLLARARVVHGGDRRERGLRRAAAARRAGRPQPRPRRCSRRSPAARARSTSTAR